MEATTKRSYERVRFNGTTAILRIEGESEQFLRGIEVDKFGEEVIPRGEWTERLHVISKDLITKRTPLVWNLTYAELE